MPTEIKAADIKETFFFASHPKRQEHIDHFTELHVSASSKPPRNLRRRIGHVASSTSSKPTKRGPCPYSDVILTWLPCSADRGYIEHDHKSLPPTTASESTGKAQP